MKPSMLCCRENHRKRPGLGCEPTSETVAIDSQGPRARSAGLEKAAALTVLLLNLSEGVSFFSPAKHARVGFWLPPVLFLRRPRIASGAWRDDQRITAHSRLNQTRQTPDARHADIVASNRRLSAVFGFSSAVSLRLQPHLTLSQSSSGVIFGLLVVGGTMSHIYTNTPYRNARQIARLALSRQAVSQA